MAYKGGALQLFVLLASLALVTVGLWSFMVAPDKSEWGSVSGALGQWVGGLAAAVAIVFTWLLARRDAAAAEARWKQDAAQAEGRWTEELRHREVSERAAEARWTAELRYREERQEKEIWTQVVRHARLVLSEVTDKFGPRGQHFISVKITNHSPEPVLFPRVESFLHPAGGDVSWDVAAAEAELDGFWAPPDWIAAGASTDLPVEINYDPKPTTEQFRAQRGTVAIIVFQDVSGHRWRRVGAQEPTLCEEGENQPLVRQRHLSGPE
jgi:hypothetical protein